MFLLLMGLMGALWGHEVTREVMVKPWAREPALGYRSGMISGLPPPTPCRSPAGMNAA